MYACVYIYIYIYIYIYTTSFQTFFYCHLKLSQTLENSVRYCYTSYDDDDDDDG